MLVSAVAPPTITVHLIGGAARVGGIVARSALRRYVDQAMKKILRCNSALSHPRGKLVQVEVVAPSADLAVIDFEGPHDL